jgi:hypothetical protein
MPRILRLTGSLTCGEYRHIYDLDEGVGIDSENWPMPNLAPDVMFLQFLLREAFAGLGIAPPGPALVPDGQFGPSTHYWILYFQMVKRRAHDLASGYDDDGFAAPFRDVLLDRAWTIEPGRSTVFTLNYQLQRCFPNFENLEKHPRLPELLRGRIAMKEHDACVNR